MRKGPCSNKIENRPHFKKNRGQTTIYFIKAVVSNHCWLQPFFSSSLRGESFFKEKTFASKGTRKGAWRYRLCTLLFTIYQSDICGLRVIYYYLRFINQTYAAYELFTIYDLSIRHMRLTSSYLVHWYMTRSVDEGIPKQSLGTRNEKYTLRITCYLT